MPTIFVMYKSIPKNRRKKDVQNHFFKFPSKRLIRFNTTTNNNNNNNMRRKNPHPQRAVNAGTVLKVVRGRREEEGEEEEEKEITVRKGTKRKRGHECDVCEKVFRYPSDVTRHMRTHTNEKPYECDVCDKAFRDSGTLKTHKRTQHLLLICSSKSIHIHVG